MTAILDRPVERDGGSGTDGPRLSVDRDPLRHRREALILAAPLLALYGFVGWWLRDVVGFAVGDAMARSADAVYVVASRDPHLAAIGFYWPPLSSLIQIPFVEFLRYWGRSDLAGPMSTAVCMAATVVVLHRICTEVGLPRFFRLAVPALFGLNPVIVYYAANGMSEASAFLCLAVGMLGLLKYCRTRRGTDLALMAGGLALAAMARVECVFVAVVVGAIATFQLRRFPASIPRSLVRAVLAALPAVYLFGLWMGVQWVLLRSPFFFIHTAGQVAGTGISLRNNPGAAQYMLPEDKYPLKVVGWVIELFWFFGPTLLLGMVYVVLRPKRARVGLALLAAAGTFVAVQLPYRLKGTAYNDPRYFTPFAVLGAVMAAWLLARAWGTWDRGGAPTRDALPRAGRRRQLVTIGASVAVLGSLVVGAVAGTVAEANPRRARVVREDIFFARILGRPRANPFRQEWVSWQATAREVDALIDAPGPKHLVICNASTCNPVVDYSRHPQNFVVENDRDFQSIVADPAGKFDLAITLGNQDPIAPLLVPSIEWVPIASYQTSGLSDGAIIRVWRHRAAPGEATGSTFGVTPGSGQ